MGYAEGQNESTSRAVTFSYLTNLNFNFVIIDEMHTLDQHWFVKHSTKFEDSPNLKVEQLCTCDISREKKTFKWIELDQLIEGKDNTDNGGIEKLLVR